MKWIFLTLMISFSGIVMAIPPMPEWIQPDKDKKKVAGPATVSSRTFMIRLEDQKTIVDDQPVEWDYKPSCASFLKCKFGFFAAKRRNFLGYLFGFFRRRRRRNFTWVIFWVFRRRRRPNFGFLGFKKVNLGIFAAKRRIFWVIFLGFSAAEGGDFFWVFSKTLKKHCLL